MPRNKKPTFATLFCGCGGFDLGFEQAGFQSLGAFDNSPVVVETYNHNLEPVAELADLSHCSAIKLPSRPNVIIAGPPCQGFSTLGKRRSDDPRNSLYVRAVEIAIGFAPEVIAIENVKGLISGKLVSHYEEAKKLLENAGYFTQTTLLQATEFGLPQIRKRVLLLATKKEFDLQKPPQPKVVPAIECVLSDVPAENHSPRWLMKGSEEFSIAKKIKPFQKLCNVRAGERSVPTWEVPDVFGHVTAIEEEVLCLIRKLRRQIRTRDVGDADPLRISDIRRQLGQCPKEIVQTLKEKKYLRSIGRRVDLTNTFNGKFRRLAMDQPSPTVDTRFGQPRYFLHPDEPRGFSVREAARIQGFPDDFLFLGTTSQQFQMVGNAVPPPVANWLANEVREKLV